MNEAPFPPNTATTNATSITTATTIYVERYQREKEISSKDPLQFAPSPNKPCRWLSLQFINVAISQE